MNAMKQNKAESPGRRWGRPAALAEWAEKHFSEAVLPGTPDDSQGRDGTRAKSGGRRTLYVGEREQARIPILTHGF